MTDIANIATLSDVLTASAAMADAVTGTLPAAVASSLSDAVTASSDTATTVMSEWIAANVANFPGVVIGAIVNSVTMATVAAIAPKAKVARKVLTPTETFQLRLSAAYVVLAAVVNSRPNDVAWDGSTEKATSALLSKVGVPSDSSWNMAVPAVKSIMTERRTSTGATGTRTTVDRENPAIGTKFTNGDDTVEVIESDEDGKVAYRHGNVTYGSLSAAARFITANRAGRATPTKADSRNGWDFFTQTPEA